uniref:Uncharacterized protein n=1 Tax=Alexandrium andersonii TaxID=327968 RepID=A0A7S2F283_9DINO
MASLLAVEAERVETDIEGLGTEAAHNAYWHNASWHNASRHHVQAALEQHAAEAHSASRHRVRGDSEEFETEAHNASHRTGLRPSPALLDPFGIPASMCPQNTGGTCDALSCHAWRGPAECHQGAKGKHETFRCRCPPGWCAFEGTCYPEEGKCDKNTEGTCTAGWCNPSRGKTMCTAGMCICEDGFCAHKGVCYPVRATGWTCGWMRGCGGDSSCVNGFCQCEEGHVWVPAQKKCMLVAR